MADRCKQAADALKVARQALFDALAAEYPIGVSVIVRHHRGQFGAAVCSHGKPWSCDVGYLVVRNAMTGKTSRRHFSDLAIARGGSNG